MKRLFFIAIFYFLHLRVDAQAPAENTAILYGVVQRNALEQKPYDKWFNEGYEVYQPVPAIINALSKLDTKNISVEIFMGTWCGDSRREVPRIYKVLDGMSFPRANIKLIAVGGNDSLYKQSPGHEDNGKGVFRVPVFIFYAKGKEIGRINEYPSVSLEKDMYLILMGKDYQPNYKSFVLINEWLLDGTLSDGNSSVRGLAFLLKMLVSGESELNSLGYLLLKQGKKEEALKIFLINANLYPQSANVLSSLGEAYYKTGDLVSATRMLETAIEVNKDPAFVKAILKVLYEVKGVK
jgi:tetratricopeptide (TPR) repeat protein